MSSMVVSGPQLPLPQTMDMDMDIDIDLGPIEEIQDFSRTINHSSLTKPIVDSNGLGSDQVSIAISDEIVPHKIFIEGVDDMNTRDLKAYAQEHFDSEAPSIEWINDTSATFVYTSADIALSALHHLTLSDKGPLDPSMRSTHVLRSAKSYSKSPRTKLQIRVAQATDKKRPRAYESSRFYLLHPHEDPRENRRQNGYHGDNDGSYRKRKYGNEEDRRRRHKDYDDGFHASMYDDHGGSSRANSVASSSRERPRRIDSYRPAPLNTNDSSRDRSASPTRRIDATRDRRRTPPPSYHSQDPYPFPSHNRDKELFPSRSSKTAGSDLFSNRMAAAKAKKELFPQKTKVANHRRSDAFDAADETAELFASGLAVPFADDAQIPAQNLSDKISGATESSYGRLRRLDSPLEKQMINQTELANGGLHIRGAAQQDQGLSIRGGASHVGTIRELFPGKANAGKELFAEKLQGRGGKRNKAEDMFY